MIFYLNKVSDNESLDALAGMFGRKYDLIAFIFYLKDPGRFFPVDRHTSAAHLKNYD